MKKILEVMLGSKREKRLPLQMHTVDKSSGNFSRHWLSELHGIFPADKF